MLSFEFEPPDESTCDCCGTRTVQLRRFVYRDGDAYSIYYAAFTDGHSGQPVFALVGLGDWSEEASPEDRVAFPLEIRATENEFQVGLVDAAHSPWRDASILGRILDREEALEHLWRDEVFELTDRLVVDDAEIARFLAGAAA